MAVYIYSLFVRFRGFCTFAERSLTHRALARGSGIASPGKAAQKKNEYWDSLAQRWDCVEWEQDQVEIRRQELKGRELAVAAREATVF